MRTGFRAIVRPHEVASSFDLVVVDASGLPHLPLTTFYQQLQNELSSGSARTYLDVLLPFFTHATSHALHAGSARSDFCWDGPPEQVRALVHGYLVHEMGCKLKRFHTYEEVRVTEHSAKTVKLFFAVLKRFYRFAVGEGWY